MDRPLARTAALVARGVVDTELASLLALTAGARLPVVVAGPAGEARTLVLDAIEELLPAEARLVALAGAAEEFEWLPEATELGWRREHHVVPANGRDAAPRATAGSTVIVARDLAGEGPGATAGARARLVVRALSVGYGLLAAMDAPDLEGVLNRLAAPDIATDEDERSRLGVVLAVADVAAGPRVLAAHYVRPLARDQHGHLQRMPPAVLATWSMATDGFDHFAWGVTPELAARVGLRPAELEREQARYGARLRSAAEPHPE